MDKSKIQLELKFSRSSCAPVPSVFAWKVDRSLSSGSTYADCGGLELHHRLMQPSLHGAAQGSEGCECAPQDISITLVEQQLCLIATYRSFRETTRGFELQSSEHFPDKALDLRSRIKSH